MAALYFCACFILTLAEFLVDAGQPIYVLKGKEVVLSPALSSTPDDILWKHNRDKVVTFDNSEGQVFPPYEGRVTLGWTTAELTIADVGYEDSGEYELEAVIRDRPYRSQFMVKVLDTVSKPVIRCDMSDESGNSTVRRATLLCSSDSDTPETLTFKWNLEGKSQLGQSLIITLGKEHDHIEYSCTATNPLQAETSVFVAEDCYTAERRLEALDVIVPIVIASLILLAFCLFPFIFRHQIKRACLNQRKNKDVEKQITETDDNSKDEDTPLMGDIHRQETFASKQPLIQQSDVMTVAPPKQENETDMDKMQTSEPAPPITNGQVDSDRATDSYRGPESERGSDADSQDSGQYYVAPEHPERQSPSLSSDSQDLQSKPLEHEADLYNSIHEAVPNTNTAGDSSSLRSDQEDTTKALEEKDSLPQPPLQMNEFGSDQDSESEPVEPESTEQTDPDDKSTSALNDPPTDVTATGESELPSDSLASLLSSKQPESPPLSPLQSSPASVQEDKEETSPETKSDPEHKDPQTDSDHESESADSNNENAEDAPLSDVQQKPPDSETSGNSASLQSDQTESQDSGASAEESDSITEENPHEQDSPSEESNESEQTSATEKTSTERPDSPPQPPHQNNVPVSDQDSQPDTVKSGSTEQTDPDDTSASASELKDPQTDVPQNESVNSEPTLTGESNDSKTSSPHSEPAESPPPSPLQSSPASDQEDKQQTSPEPKSDSEHNHPLTDSDHESVSSDNHDENGDVAQTEKSDTDHSARSSASSETDQKENQDPVTNVEDSTSDKKPHKQDSPSEESEESKLTSATDKPSTGDTEMPGSVKEAAESTHQPQL